MNATQVHRRIRAFVRATPAPHGGWLDGSCWILAEALHRALGCPLVAVVGHPPALDARAPDATQHVAVLCRGTLVVDGDGVSTIPKLIRRWQDVEGITNARLVPFSGACRASAERGGIPQPRDTDGLVLALRRALEAP